MRRRNKINSKKKEISTLAKTIKSLKEDDYETDFQRLKDELAIKTYEKDLKRNSSLKIYAYNQKKYFPNCERNNKKLTYNISSTNCRNKNNNYKNDEQKLDEKNKFLIHGDENYKNDIRIFIPQEKKNKCNSKIRKSFNTSSNTNRDIKNKNYNNFRNNQINREKYNIIYEEKNNSNVNDSISKYINNIYEDKITKLKEDIKILKQDKERTKSNFILFVSLIKKFANKLYILFDKNKNNNYEPEEIMNTLFSLNEFIEKIEINNFSVEENIKIEKIFAQNSLIESQEIEKNINEIISKYEMKINILNEQNEEMLEKIEELKNENNMIKMQLQEENEIKEKMLHKLNKMKEINNSLEQKNKILDCKCRSYVNQSTRNKYEQKNFEDEIDYKNKIIKYLENLLQQKDYDQNDEILKKMNERNINNINKIMDLKKNLKKVIYVTKNFSNNNEENEKSINLMNSNENNSKIKFNRENLSHYLNDKSNSSFSNKMNNTKIKKEIDLLDKEIETIQCKLETMVKN